MLDEVTIRAAAGSHEVAVDAAGKGIIYPFTNESLASVVTGLQPTNVDVILAVCGSGDQAFALLESGARVVAVDTNERQVAYARARADALLAGDVETFLKQYDAGFKNKTILRSYRTRYFGSSLDRLDAIANGIANCTFEHASVFDVVADRASSFTKIYLSNAIDHVIVPDELWNTFFRFNGEAIAEARDKLLSLEDLPSGGLIFASDTFRRSELVRFLYGALPWNQQGNPIIREKTLTKTAKQPIGFFAESHVYRRV